jgi:hypothetical protein
MSYGSYQVTVTNLDQPVVMGTGTVTNLGTPVSRTVRVVTHPKTFSHGLLARTLIDVNGNKARIDSYDSSSSAYSTLAQYDSLKATDRADVGSLQGGASITLGNGNIYGSVLTTPDGSISLGPNGAIGTFTWQASHTGIQSGYTSDNLRVEVADAQLPSFGTLWNPPSGKIGSVGYDMILGSGDYSVAKLSGKVLVQGVANLVVTSSINLSGSDGVTLAPGARLNIYMEGTSTTIKGNGFINPGSSTNVAYYGLPTNTSIEISGNAAFNGLIYAPEANMILSGGGSNNEDCSGAFVCNSIKLNGNFNFHDDLNARNFILLGYFPTSWTEL